MAQDIKINIGAKDNASRVFGRVGASLKKLSVGASQLAASMTRAASIGMAAFSAAAVKMTSDFAKAGDQLDKMSKRTGVSVEALSELKFAAEQSGASIESIEKAIRGMQRALLTGEQGSKEIIESLEAIGLTIADLQGMNPEDQFTLIADELAKLEDHSRKAGLAMKLFGRSGTEILPMLADGSQGIKELRDELIALGGQMSGEQAAAAAEYTDAMNELKTALLGIRNAIGTAVLPALTEIADVVKMLTLDLQDNALVWREMRLAMLEALNFGGVFNRQISEVRGAIQSLQEKEMIESLTGQTQKTGGMFEQGEKDADDYLDGLQKGLERAFINRPNLDFFRSQDVPSVQATTGRLLRGGPGLSPAEAQGRRIAQMVERMERFLEQGVPVRVIEDQTDEGENEFQMERVS